MIARRQDFIPFATAVLLASGWFAFWLTAVREEKPAPHLPRTVPAVIRLHPDVETEIRELLNPTLFALPSTRGFSAGFPGRQIDARLSLERPGDPALFLEREEALRVMSLEGKHDD